MPITLIFDKVPSSPKSAKGPESKWAVLWKALRAKGPDDNPWIGIPFSELVGASHAAKRSTIRSAARSAGIVMESIHDRDQDLMFVRLVPEITPDAPPSSPVPPPATEMPSESRIILPEPSDATERQLEPLLISGSKSKKSELVTKGGERTAITRAKHVQAAEALAAANGGKLPPMPTIHRENITLYEVIKKRREDWFAHLEIEPTPKYQAKMVFPADSPKPVKAATLAPTQIAAPKTDKVWPPPGTKPLHTGAKDPAVVAFEFELMITRILANPDDDWDSTDMGTDISYHSTFIRELHKMAKDKALELEHDRDGMILYARRKIKTGE